MEKYQKIEKLGEGTYGIVYKAQDRYSSSIVALKRIRLDNEEEGVPCTAIREVSLLKELKHPNIITLFDVIHTEKKLTLVFEFMDTDLKKFIDSNQGDLSINVIKNLTHQLLQGINYIHTHRVLHRDLKPQNLLLSKKLELKIADFGLARAVGVPVRGYSHEVVTLWYRAPDVLLGSRNYTFSIDIWYVELTRSIGCILGEMAMGRPLFAGSGVHDQLMKIVNVMGSPTESRWPGMTTLPEYKPLPHYEKMNLLGMMPKLGDVGVQLLELMLDWDQEKRVSASDALQHSFFEGFGTQ